MAACKASFRLLWHSSRVLNCCTISAKSPQERSENILNETQHEPRDIQMLSFCCSCRPNAVITYTVRLRAGIVVSGCDIVHRIPLPVPTRPILDAAYIQDPALVPGL